MISQFLKDCSQNKGSSCFKNYVKLETNVYKILGAFDSFRKLNLSTDLIDLPCLLSITTGDRNKIAVEYYSTSLDLITSIITSTLDKYSNLDLYNYYCKISDEFKVSNDDLKNGIWKLNRELKNSNILNCEEIINKYRDPITTLMDLVELHLPMRSREVIEFAENLKLNNLLFCKSITVYSGRDTDSISVLNCGNLCAGLFEVNQGRYDSDVITENNYEETYSVIKEKLTQPIGLNEVLAYNNENSIYYSITILEYVGRFIRR